MPKGSHAAVTLTDSDRATLLSWSRSRTRSRVLAQRAHIVLACAENAGAGDAAIAEQLGISRDMVHKWRMRFLAEGLNGLDDRPRSGRPRKADGEAVVEILMRLLGPPPGDGREWSTRAMAAETGLSQATVSRIWRDHRLQVRAAGRKQPLGGDRRALPAVEVRDVAGLFLDPPTRVLAVIVRRPAPSPRHRTTTPAAAAPPVHRLATRARNLLAVADALALVRHPADMLGPSPDASLNAFLQSLEHAVHAHADVLLLVGSEPDAAVRDMIDTWVRQRPRLHQHLVSTGASWFDTAEGLLTNPPPLGHEHATGYVASLPTLRDALRAWRETWKRSAAPFAWTSPTYDSSAIHGGQQDGPAPDDHRITGVVTAVESAASDMSDPVVQHILEALLTASLPSGEKVKESPLATRLGLSRRAVRRALRVLAEEGLLERAPDGGTVVPRVDITTVLDLYAARAALGTVLMRRAAMLNASALHPVRAALAEVRTVAHRSDHGRIGEADLRFQDAVARIANLSQASLFFQRLTLRLRMFIAVLGLDFPDAAADLIAREDARIFESICDGDGDEAARIWRVKVERSVRYMSAQLPGNTFDPNLWATIAGKPTSRPGDPRKTATSPSA